MISPFWRGRAERDWKKVGGNHVSDEPHHLKGEKYPKHPVEPAFRQDVVTVYERSRCSAICVFKVETFWLSGDTLPTQNKKSL